LFLIRQQLELKTHSMKTKKKFPTFNKSDKTAKRAAKAVDEGRDRKANRLFKKAARQENREIRREERRKYI
jgi:hypothetical protein